MIPAFFTASHFGIIEPFQSAEDERMERNWTKICINAATVVLLLACVGLAAWLWRLGAFRSVEALRTCVDGFGVYGASVFIAMQAAQVVVPFLPGGVSCAAGVLLFGPWQGFLWNYIGIVIGSLAAFALARNLGKPLLEKLFSKKLRDKYEKWTQENKRFDRLFALAILLPGLPDDFLCFLAGTAGMTWRKFTAITFLARAPMIFVYSLAGLGVLHFLPNLF